MEMTIIVENKNNICTFLTFVNVNMHVIITNRGNQCRRKTSCYVWSLFGLRLVLVYVNLHNSRHYCIRYFFFFFLLPDSVHRLTCLLVQARQQITSLETIRLRRTMHIFTISAKQGFYCKTKHAFKSNVIFARKCL